MKKIATITITAGIVFLLCACSQPGTVTQIGNIVEVGTQFNIEEVFTCDEGVTIGLQEGSTVDTSAIGDVTASFVIASGKKEEVKEFSFHVVDTTAPVIKADNVRIVEGNNFDPEKGVTCEDNSGEAVTPIVTANDVDLKTPGSYSVTFSAEDSSGNTAEKTIRVEVLAKGKDSQAQKLPDNVTIKSANTQSFTLILLKDDDDEYHPLSDFSIKVLGRVEVEWEDDDHQKGEMEYSITIDDQEFAGSGTIEYYTKSGGMDGYSFSKETGLDIIHFCFLKTFSDGKEYFGIYPKDGKFVYFFQED